MRTAHETSAGTDHLDLNLVRVLLAVDEERSVTRAARRLGVTQSAASRSLQRLRESVGDPLFLREKDAMIPTPRAAALIARVRPAAEALSAALSERPAFDPARARRTFAIGTADYGQAVLLPALAAHLQRTAPGVDLVVTSPGADLADALGAAQLDLFVGPRGHTQVPWLVWRPLFRESFACVLRRGHPALRGRFTAARFAELPQVLVAPTGRPGGVVDEVLRQRGLSRRVAVRVSSFLAAPAIVAASDLALTLPARLAARVARTHPVVAVRPPVEIPGFEMALAWHERLRHEPGHAWMRRVVEEVGRGI